MRRRRIAAVTGSRADYGILRPVLEAVRADRRLELRLVVTGSHLSRRHGMTVSEIVADRIPIAARAPLPLASDTAPAVCAALAQAVKSLGAAFSRLRPDLILLLGDRYEILAAAAAALPLKLPVAHIHGGDLTAGAWDESVRHAVTKLSHLHFPATPLSAARLRRMGEPAARIHCFGSPGADALRAFARIPRARLEAELGTSLRSPVALVTFHPATLRPDLGLSEFRAVLGGLAGFPGTLVFTSPNADLGGAAIDAALRRFLRTQPPGKAAAVRSLGHRRYVSLLALADVMVGNSSSGLLEAPYFRLPAVNVGTRQDGRERHPNVLDAPASPRAVRAALRRALSHRFRAALNPPPGAARPVAPRIARVLASTPLGEALLRKEFS